MTDKQKESGGAARPSGTLGVEKLAALPPTRAERVKALEAQYKGTSERFVRDGVVFMALSMENMDRICGRGANTEDALTHLESRLVIIGEG